MKTKIRWKISIDDGHCEYQYKFLISNTESIYSVAEKIRDTFKVKMSKGKLRKEEV